MAAAKSLQSQARTLEIFTTIAIVIVVLGLTVEFVLAFAHGEFPWERAFWDIHGESLIRALPTLLLAGALDASRKLFGRLARGDLFSEAVGQGVKGIGASLLYAAAAMAVIVPWLIAWTEGKYGFGGIDLEPTTWVLGIVGAALLMLGRLLRQANALQDELERFV